MHGLEHVRSYSGMPVGLHYTALPSVTSAAVLRTPLQQPVHTLHCNSQPRKKLHALPPEDQRSCSDRPPGAVPHSPAEWP